MRPKRSGSNATAKDSEDTSTASSTSPESKIIVVKTEESDDGPPKIVPRETRELSNRSGSDFTPPPALSPAHSLQDDVKMEQEDREEEEEDDGDADFEMFPKKKEQVQVQNQNQQKKKQVGMRKITSSPAIVRMEKVEKSKYKKKDKDAVPYLDPNAPKRNRSAYVHFIITRRSAYSKAVMSQRDINIALAADWQKLTADERKPYHAKAEEEKGKYIELMEEYKKTDSHKEFQKKRSDWLSQSNRKRKHGAAGASDDSDDDGKEHVQMNFPKTDVFCPLLNPASDSAATSSGLQYAGPIFTPEFMSYNKTRDSYRRQLAIERSNVEHELEALHEHDVEVKIQKQITRLRSIDEKTDEAMKTLRSVLGGVAGAKDHLSDIDSLTEWLQTVIKMGPRDVLRKSVRESFIKHSKSLKK